MLLSILFYKCFVSGLLKYLKMRLRCFVFKQNFLSSREIKIKIGE